MVNTLKKRIAQFAILTSFLLFAMYIIPKTLGLGAGGFDTELVLKQFFFYATGVAIIGITGIFVYKGIIGRDNKYGESIGYSEPGAKPSLSIFQRMSQFQLLLLSIIVFGVAGLIAVFTKQETFTGIPLLEQQFTRVGSILYSAFLIPIAENLDAAFVFAMGVLFLTIIAIKTNMKEANYQLIFLGALPWLFAIFGAINHLLRYGSSETSLVIVFMFWLVGGYLTAITGSFIPFWIMHVSNNLFIDLQKFFGSDTITIWTVAILVVLAGIYVFMYVIRKKKSEVV